MNNDNMHIVQTTKKSIERKPIVPNQLKVPTASISIVLFLIIIGVWIKLIMRTPPMVTL